MADEVKKYISEGGAEAIAQGIANIAPKTWRLYPDDESTVEEGEDGNMSAISFPTPAYLFEHISEIKLGDYIDASELTGCDLSKNGYFKLQVNAVNYERTGDAIPDRYTVIASAVCGLEIYVALIDVESCGLGLYSLGSYNSETLLTGAGSSWPSGFPKDWGKEWRLSAIQSNYDTVVYKIGARLRIQTNISGTDAYAHVQVVGVSNTDTDKYAIAVGLTPVLSPNGDAQSTTAPGIFVIRKDGTGHYVSYYPLLNIWQDIYEQKNRVKTIEENVQTCINQTVEYGFPQLWVRAGGMASIGSDDRWYWEITNVDLTIEEAVEIYDLGHIHYGNAAYYYAGTNIKAALPIRSHVPVNCEGTFMDCANLQRVEDDKLIPGNKCFKGCKSLREAFCFSPVGEKGQGSLDAYEGCVNLEMIKFVELNGSDINLKDSPKLLADALMNFATENRNKLAFTITVHPDVYAKLTVDDGSDYNKAFVVGLENNITFATV